MNEDLLSFSSLHRMEGIFLEVHMYGICVQPPNSNPDIRTASVYPGIYSYFSDFIFVICFPRLPFPD